MDPIHPIEPRPPAITPLTGGRESDRPAREQREQRRREQARRERERKNLAGGDRSDPQRTPEPHSPPADEGPRHIDVRA